MIHNNVSNSELNTMLTNNGVYPVLYKGNITTGNPPTIKVDRWVSNTEFKENSIVKVEVTDTAYAGDMEYTLKAGHFYQVTGVIQGMYDTLWTMTSITEVNERFIYDYINALEKYVDTLADKLSYISKGETWESGGTAGVILAGSISSAGTHATFSLYFDKEIKSDVNVIARANNMILRQIGKTQYVVNNPTIQVYNVGKHNIQFNIQLPAGYTPATPCTLVFDRLVVSF